MFGIERKRKTEKKRPLSLKWAAVKKKVKLEHVRHQSSIKCVTRKFLEVSPCSHPKKRQRNVEKNCCSCKVVFLLVRPIVVFKSHNRTERESKGVLTSYGRFFVEEGQFIKYTPPTSSLRQPFFFHLLTRLALARWYLPEVNQLTGNCFRMVRIVLKLTFLKLRYPKGVTGRLPLCPITALVVFHRCRCLQSLALHNFIFCLSKL